MAFQAGLDAALKLGADVIVNTDGDNQYFADDIKKLVEPIVGRKADLVIGSRDIANHTEFSKSKKMASTAWLVGRSSCFENRCS